MEKLIIYKNKSEMFECQLNVDGASTEDIEIRLCLEFSDNKNFFFYGKISDNGECSIQIPKLTEIDSDKSGRLSVEAIADSTYFKLYECDVSFKNSVEVKMKKGGKFFSNHEAIKETKIELAGIEKVPQPKPVISEEDVVEDEPTPEVKKPEPKKSEVKKSEPKKAEAKKPEPKKPEKLTKALDEILAKKKRRLAEEAEAAELQRAPINPFIPKKHSPDAQAFSDYMKQRRQA